jgi:hypothetical protein
MAWNEKSNCAYCGDEIPALRRLSNGRFCSKEHAQEYVQQQTQLAVDVLHRTHDALKAYRPKGSSIEDILGIPQDERVGSSSAVALEESSAPFVLPPPIVAPPPPAPVRSNLVEPGPVAAPQKAETAKKVSPRTESPWWRRMLAMLWPLQPAHRS